jgi:hypothetical protein
MSRQKLALGGVILLFLGFLMSCGSGSTATQSVSVTMQAANYSQSSKGVSRGLTATNTNNGVSNGVSAFSILSAAPEQVIVYLQSIAVTSSSSSGSGNNGNGTAVWTSTQSNTTASGTTVTGCPITLQSGTTNLSGCTGLSTLSIAQGSYTGLVLTFAEVGQMKGCIQGKFGSSISAVGGTHTYPSQFPQTIFSYTTDTVTAGTLYTYCTRSDQSYYNAETASTTPIGNDASYQPSATYFSTLTDAALVDIDLGSGNNNAQTMAQLKQGTVKVTSSNAFTVGSTATTLNLVVDLNRMLEFYSNTRSDFNPPGPSMHAGTSYFFTTKFSQVGSTNAVGSVSAFANTIGSVQGYQLTDTTDNVAGWFTLYLDSSGNYLGGIIYEDDDDALTIMKGNATLTSGTLSGGATISMDISSTTLTNFKTLSTVGSTATATLSYSGGHTVSYQRLL